MVLCRSPFNYFPFVYLETKRVIKLIENMHAPRNDVKCYHFTHYILVGDVTLLKRLSAICYTFLGKLYKSCF